MNRDEVQRTAKRCDDDGHGRGLRLPLVAAAVVMVARAHPPRTNRQTSNTKEKRRGVEILAALRRVMMGSSILCFQPISNYDKYRCRVQDVASVCLVLFSLTQAWNFLNAPLGRTVAFAASICLQPLPLRSCTEPQAGVSPPRRSPLVCIHHFV